MELVNLGRRRQGVAPLPRLHDLRSSRWRPWVLDEEASLPFFRRAWEAGINFFDTADMYSGGGSEEVLGRALRSSWRSRASGSSSPPRSSTRSVRDDPNQRGLSRKHIRHAIDASLRRLRTRSRRPVPDPPLRPRPRPSRRRSRRSTPWSAPARRSTSGRSSMYAWQIAKMLYTSDRRAWPRFVTMQNHYNLVYREEEREMIPLCRDEGDRADPLEPAGAWLSGR